MGSHGPEPSIRRLSPKHPGPSGRPLHILAAKAGIGGGTTVRVIAAAGTNRFRHQSHPRPDFASGPPCSGEPFESGSRGGACRLVHRLSSWAHRCVRSRMCSMAIRTDPGTLNTVHPADLPYGQSRRRRMFFSPGLSTVGRRAKKSRPSPAHILQDFRREIKHPARDCRGGGAPGGGHGGRCKRRGGVYPVQKGMEILDRAGRATSNVWRRHEPELEGMGGLYAQDCDIARLLDHTDPEVILRRTASALRTRSHGLRTGPGLR